jgi:hypothetical protein
MIASLSCKSVRCAGCLSIGRGRARPHIRQSSQIIRQFVELGATRCLFVNRFTVEELVASARFKSAS